MRPSFYGFIETVNISIVDNVEEAIKVIG